MVGKCHDIVQRNTLEGVECVYLTQNRNRRVLVNTSMKFAITRNVGISRGKSKYFEPILTK